jgi:flagellar motor protein MotB
MEDSAFQPASFAITPQLKLRINDVLVRLAPHFENIQLTVVGHADRSTLLSKSPLMEDNFDLSSIRALKVLKYMVSKGFPEKKASARASSFFDRDARSISIVIQPASLL